MADKEAVLRLKTVKEGNGAVQTAKELEQVEKQAKKTGDATAAAGEKGEAGFNSMAVGIGKAVAAFAAIKGVIDFFASSVQAANENARAVNTLAAAYNAVGYTAQGAMKQAQDFATKMQSLTGIADEAFLNAQRLLANYGVVGTKAQEAVQAAYALSIGRGMEFGAAMDVVAKAAAGQTQTLARYGIQIDKNTESGAKFDAVLAQINERFGATAQAAMGDSTTKLNALKESWGDFKEQVGAGLNDGLVPAVDFLTGAVNFLSKAFKSAGAIFGIVFDQIMISANNAKGSFYLLAEGALKALDPIVHLVSYLPGVGEDISAAFENAKESLSQMSDSAFRQSETLKEMRTPLSAIWETEKDITEEQKARRDLQAEEINNRREILNLTQEQTAAELEQAEQRATTSQQNTDTDEKSAQDKLGLKKWLGIQEEKDERTHIEKMTAMLRQGSKEQMAVQKAQGIAQATIATYQMANDAYKALAGIPIVGPVLAAAAAAAAIAYGLSNVAQISGVKLAEGGLVKAVTGGVPAVIGEGGSDEAVLPLDDSQAMRRIGGAIAEQSGGAMGGVVVNINVQATGGVEAILEQLTDAARTGTVQALEFANINYKTGQEQQGYSV